MATFHLVPAWQGSPSARAMQLIAGAEVIGENLPRASTVTIPVPPGAGEALGTGVARFSSVLTTRDAQREALAHAQGPVITVGGGCSVELAAVEHALEATAGDLCVVWCDAHADLSSPDTSQPGAADRSTLRLLLGGGEAALAPGRQLASDSVVLVGIRSTDEAQADFVRAHRIRQVDSPNFSAESLIEAVAATGASSVYVHVDLDVLDPSEFAGLHSPEPFGVPTSTLAEALRALLEVYPSAGAGLTGFAPSPGEPNDDLTVLLRLLGALSTRATPRAAASDW